MTKISAIIITLNEERHIGQCIESLQGVADEVIVVDSLSRDKTRAISEGKGAKVMEKEFAGFGAQKNEAAAGAANDYILSIDADEALSDDLRQSILQLKTNLSRGAYYVNRLNYIGESPIKTCGWYPDIRVRLYNRNNAQWDTKEVHEQLETSDKVIFLKGDLLHYSYEDYEDMKKRSEAYARLGASAVKGKSKIALVIKMLVNPIAKFIKAYILQRGVMDGYAGWMISRYKARETFLKYYWALG